MTGADPLFDHTAQRLGYVEMGEPIFDFLARDGVPGTSDIREWMEDEWKEIPIGGRKGLRRRLMAKDYKQFIGAYSELLVHCMLRRLGVVIEIEPSIVGTSKTVDFRCTAHDDVFLVEATASGMGGTSAKQNLNDVMRKINENVGSPHSHVDLMVEGRLEVTLPKEDVVKPIVGLLNRWSAEEVRRHESRRGIEGMAFVPIATSVSRGDWKLTVELRPVETGRVGRVWGPITVDDVVESGVVTDVSMGDALRNKASHLRGLRREDELVFVAINAVHGLAGVEELEARIGRVMYSDDLGRVTGLGFAGFLRNIDGVIVLDNATLGNERAAFVKLYRNGQRQIPDCLKCLLRGRALGSLIGLG